MRTLFLLFITSALWGSTMTAFAEGIPKYGFVEAPSYGSAPLSPDISELTKPEQSTSSQQDTVEQRPSSEQTPQNDEKSADITVFEQKVRVLLKSVTEVETLLQKKKKLLSFFGIPTASIRSYIAKHRSSISDIDHARKNADIETAKRLADTLYRDPKIAELDQSLRKFEEAYELLKNVRNKEIKTILLKPVKSIKKSVKTNNFKDVHEALNIYTENLRKNKNLYSAKNLIKNSKKQIEKNMKKIDDIITARMTKLPENIPQMTKKSPITATKKRRDSNIDKMNDALQNRIKADAIFKTIDLGSGIR